MNARTVEVFSLMFVPRIIRCSKHNQHCALNCTNLYSIYWLLHVSAVACHYQGASYILLSYMKYISNGWYIIQLAVTWLVWRSVVVPSIGLPSTIDVTTTLRHTGYVTTHYMIYHPFDLYFK
jgi:hypothetical protein